LQEKKKLVKNLGKQLQRCEMCIIEYEKVKKSMLDALRKYDLTLSLCIYLWQ
jgi:hypothetical protein